MAPRFGKSVSPHRILFVIFDVTTILLLVFAILGVPLIKTVSVYQGSLSIKLGSVQETFQVRLGVLGFCHGIGLTECSHPGFPYGVSTDAIGELHKLPLVGDAAQGIETAIAGVAFSFLGVFLAAVPLHLGTLIHDSCRTIPGLASKSSIFVSLLNSILSIVAYVVTVAIFGTFGGAVNAVADASQADPLVGGAGPGIGSNLMLAAGIIQLVAFACKFALIKRLREAQSYGKSARFGMEMSQY